MTNHHHHSFGDYDYDYDDIDMDPAAFAGNVSYSSSRPDAMVDPQLASHSAMGYQQPSTSSWLPVATSGFHSAGTSGQADYSWGHDPQGANSSLMDPMPSQPTQGRASTLATSSYHSGQPSAWPTNPLGQPQLQGGFDNFTAFQSASATHQGTSSSQRGSTASRATAQGTQGQRGQAGRGRGGRSEAAQALPSQYSTGDYYLSQPSGHAQGYGAGLMNYSASYTSGPDDFFFTTTAPQAGGSKAATQSSPGLSLTEDLLFNHDKNHLSVAGPSTQRDGGKHYASSAYSVSDYEPSIAASIDFPHDGGPSHSASRQPSPGPSSSTQKKLGKGKEKEAQTLKCTFEGCTSKAVFTRQCDLAKHYRQHFRKYQCRIEGCQASAGFATKKDRARHERTHNPSILCDHCGRKFSRQDNLRDHVRRRH